MAPGRKADDGSRTRDLELGKLALYQLSYVRSGGAILGAPRRLSTLRRRERARLRRLPRRPRRRRPARLRPAEEGQLLARARRAGPGRDDRAARARAATGAARSPTTAAAGCWSTSGPRGASLPERVARRSSASTTPTAARTSPSSASTPTTCPPTRLKLREAATASPIRSSTTATATSPRTTWDDRRARVLPRQPPGQARAPQPRPGHRALPGRQRHALHRPARRSNEARGAQRIHRARDRRGAPPPRRARSPPARCPAPRRRRRRTSPTSRTR